MPISIIIPAHNEEAVIERCLAALMGGAGPGELEVIVVCNGCTDRTAERARAFGVPVCVIETEVPSKSNALNLGDAAAVGFPRIYSDADVILSLESVRAMARRLDDGHVLAVAPAVLNVFPLNAAWGVRAYYEFWMALPYVQEGMMAAGVYGVSRKGRTRFGQFPDLIADDGYFRVQFDPDERVEVAAAQSVVATPARFWDLVKIKTRSRLGYYQLQTHYPELLKREARSKGYGRALRAIFRRPRLWPCAIPYLLVNLLSRRRALRQLRSLENYVWERDNSSRGSTSVALTVAQAASQASSRAV